MRIMGRVNVYIPDDLAEEAKAAGLNISGLTQEAIRSALAKNRMRDWLASLPLSGSSTIPQDVVEAALAGAKDEIEGRDRKHWDEVLEGMAAEQEASDG